MRSEPLNHAWKDRLLLSMRAAPEYYDSPESVVDGPHSSAIRAALTELGVSGVFCIQGVPTVLILSMPEYNRNTVVDLHGALWNQGLASVLLIISGDIVRVFSLARVPLANLEEFERRCLVETLNATTDALALKNFLYSAESGRLWVEHANYFRTKERIDHVLLENLIESYKQLRTGRLPSDAAQALLIQTMFIAYLEDREIITSDYFRSALRRNIDSFLALLQTRDSSLLNRLFDNLRDDFNGDLFVAPCSFESDKAPSRITASHLDTLFRFRTGHEEMGHGGQYRFWGYNFKYIPVELISAVYDRFLGEKDDERRNQGAYYTPMFLADTVISQLWDSLPPDTKDRGDFFDPACGSGMFLVRSFQRLCDHRRNAQARQNQSLRWDTLINTIKRLHGSDVNGSAVRVAVFSLYIALLEEVSPPDIRQLLKKGRILPTLWGKNLTCEDFFKVDPATKVDVLIGNPPWASRRGNERHSVAWCNKNKKPMPEGEDAWAFTWKALQHLKPNGVLAFLVPAMSFLHNLAPSSCEARKLLLRESRVLRIVNFSDLRFQLFEGAVRSTALLLCTLNATPDRFYKFEYWTPRADVNLKIRRFISLTPADRKSLNSHSVNKNPLEFKHQLWMRSPDAKLFNYLSSLPKLSDKIRVYRSARHDENELSQGWVIGYGFQPDRGTSDRRAGAPRVAKSGYVGELPYLPIEAFTPLGQSTKDLAPWKSNKVFRRGFEAAFHAPKILIPRGVGTAAGRLRASYTEDPLTFKHSIQAIAVPQDDAKEAKLLTALLNSRVAVWYAFHGTSSFGSERPEVQQRDLLRLPFPTADDLPDPGRARQAASGLIEIIDSAVRQANAPFSLRDSGEIFQEVDRLAYEYFCLSTDEILLIEDAVEQLIPAVQPSQGSFPSVWMNASAADRCAYADVLLKSLERWFDDESLIRASLEASNADLAILRLTLNDKGDRARYQEQAGHPVGEALEKLAEHIHQPLPGNFQLLPDFRIFVGKNIYLVKPTQKRFWLRSTALADADAIALDIQGTLQSRKALGRAE